MASGCMKLRVGSQVEEGQVYFVALGNPGANHSRSRDELDDAGLNTAVYQSVDHCVADLRPQQPGCIVVELPREAAHLEQAVDRLLEQASVPVLIVHGASTVPVAVSWMKKGARDFLAKPANGGDLVGRVRRLLDQDGLCCSYRNHRHGVLERMKRLTPRERQVMDLVVSGLPNKQIASRIGVSIKTVEVHRSRVMGKMDAGSLADLVRQHMVAHCRDPLPLEHVSAAPA